MIDLASLITARINAFIPKRAVDLKIATDHIEYLHPTRGWKRVAFRRMGNIGAINAAKAKRHDPYGSKQVGGGSPGAREVQSEQDAPHSAEALHP